MSDHDFEPLDAFRLQLERLSEQVEHLTDNQSVTLKVHDLSQLVSELAESMRQANKLTLATATDAREFYNELRKDAREQYAAMSRPLVELVGAAVEEYMIRPEPKQDDAPTGILALIDRAIPAVTAITKVADDPKSQVLPILSRIDPDNKLAYWRNRVESASTPADVARVLEEFYSKAVQDPSLQWVVQALTPTDQATLIAIQRAHSK